MLKCFVYSLVIVLLVSAGATAGIQQLQDFTIGVTNAVDLLHGHSSGIGSQIAVVNSEQFAPEVCRLWAIQDENAILHQAGSAVGRCAVLSLLQQGAAIGAQEQFLTDGCGPKSQGQVLGVGLVQEITRSEGPGGASATHDFVGDRLQALGSVSGSMSQDQFLHAIEQTDINGAADSEGRVTSGAVVTATQLQAID